MKIHTNKRANLRNSGDKFFSTFIDEADFTRQYGKIEILTIATSKDEICQKTILE